MIAVTFWTKIAYCGKSEEGQMWKSDRRYFLGKCAKAYIYAWEIRVKVHVTQKNFS
jgi:hypothetical protein